MARFAAKRIDLDLELSTITGETIEIPGPSQISGSQAGLICERLNDEDKRFDDQPAGRRSPVSVAKHVARQLAEFYGDENYEAKWWLDNLDMTTLNEIKLYIVETLLGAKKKTSGSNK